MHKNYRIKGIAFLSLILGLSAIPMVNATECVDGSSSTSMLTPSDLNNDRTMLHASVSSAFANGQLTDIQADSIRAKLTNNCKLQEAFLSDGVLAVSEAQEVKRSIDGIEDSLQAALTTTVAANAAQFEGAVMANTPLNPTISMSRFYKYGFGEDFVNGGPDLSSNIANFNNKEILLSAQLEQGRTDGRLSATEYFFLKGQLNDAAARTQKIADLRTRFTWGEQEKMISKLDGLQAKVNDHLSNNEIAFNDGTM